MYDTEITPTARSIGKLLRARTNTGAESLRAGWAEWLSGMQFSEFGTLTLAPNHGKNCRGRDCDGLSRRGSINCFVPGVQKSEKLVNTFSKLCSRSFVVEELAPITGRRHFHYLANGSQIDRYEERYCLREMANRSHVHHEVGFTAIGFWRKFGGRGVVEVINSTRLSVEYVLKDLIENEDNRFWIQGTKL